MTTADDQTEICTFVVRIWLEDGEDENEWRGHITHVLSDERRHFETVDAMDAFVVAHIRRMQAKAFC